MTPLIAARTQDALAAVRSSPSLLAGLECFDALTAAVHHDGDAARLILAAAIGDDRDQIAAIAAVHAAAAGGVSLASALVVPLLDCAVPFLREHAAWSLRASSALPGAVAPLLTMMEAGGFTGTLAEATLEAWGMTDPEIGVVDEGPHPRVCDLDATGLTVAQLFLHADIDGSLLQAGKGDTGGIATLLVHVGDALVTDPRISRVLTLSRSHHGITRTPDDPTTPGHHYLGVPLPGPARPAAATWPLHVPARSGLRSVLRAAAPIDVLHLRMADVGSWAAAEVARELDIPLVLTLAPDPHALIAAREASGNLTRATFGAADHAEHLVFRVRLLRDLAAQAAHLVVFPRAELGRDLRDLLHFDPDVDERPLHVVPEGIDLAPLDRAAREVHDASRGAPVAADTEAALTALDSLLATLPPERRGLPLAITVGRLHRVKGMATLVEAWSSDDACAKRCNLLVVGGGLQDPTDDELEQLTRIDASVPRADAAANGLLLAGHRPNGMVATWLAAVRLGRPGLSAPGGVYVSASLKEEFGIAILEAMASGLVVIAPRAGGPATYVEHGVTGLLVDTTSPSTLAGAVVSALDLAGAPDAAARADHARALVAERFSIATMAASLSVLYSEVARDAARHQP
ncbi:MAG: glycosyltransferase [Ornithinimicrobium sp.]|uniref:glycosyltransferase n=1 Tax=Ornithinimicrobium sp. TaxID=1977084 RepID=UPI0026E105CF|nr:glycosyltransferase [Ornithinimicrobium sp.]MDO5738617.1 glycosyltransferase [Ornithinimicrobium sp.]